MRNKLLLLSAAVISAAVVSSASFLSQSAQAAEPGGDTRLRRVVCKPVRQCHVVHGTPGNQRLKCETHKVCSVVYYYRGEGKN